MGCLLVACVVSGCGGKTMVKPPSAAVQRDVAGRFADAVLRGDATGARALLVQRDKSPLTTLVDLAARPWKTHHASIRLPARHTGTHWTFSYTGRHTQKDGGFETQSGDLVVVVASSGAGARVQFFAVTHIRTRFSTHHDAQLPPSKR